MNESDLEPVDETVSVLVVGGVDSSGGAGLAVDVEVVRCMGLHPLPVATAVTAQNSRGVRAVQAVPAEIVAAQLDAVGAEYQIGAVKIGMAGTRGNVEAIAAWLAQRPRLPAVLDPVLKASSGGDLAPEGVPRAIEEMLFPRIQVITPNLAELGRYSGLPATARDDVPPAARALRAKGCPWVLATGGHLRGPYSNDFLCGETELWLEGRRSEHPRVRGTGCALATALACSLANGETMVDAAWSAKNLVTNALERSYVAGEDRHLQFK